MGAGPESREFANYLQQRRSLEPVPEEYIESEDESAVEFPQVNKTGDQSTLSNNKSQNEKLSKTQPINNLKEVNSYNTINTTSIVNKS